MKLNTLLLLLLTLSCETQKVAMVNINEALIKYHKSIKAEQDLKKIFTSLEEEALKMEKTHKKLISEYQSLIQSSGFVIFTKEQKAKQEAKMKEIRSLEKKMKAFNKGARESISRKTQEAKTENLKEISLVINRLAKKKNLDAVIDKPAILYTKKGLNWDITNEVIAILNKGHEKEVKERENQTK